MKISQIVAREIYDSRGLPTLECEIFLENGSSVLASVPAGKSKGIHEALELRDGGKRLFGKGVLKARDLIEQTIAPELKGKEPDVLACDHFMIERDGTTSKAKIGANTMLAVSMAMARAQAVNENMELYEFLSQLYGAQTVSLPYPMFNIINGGMHADSNLKVQEIMVVPFIAESFKHAMELGATLFYELRILLQKAGKHISFGDEGGYAANFSSITEAFDLILEAINAISEGSFGIALDCAASQFYNVQSQCYELQNGSLSSQELIDFYASLMQRYPLYSIEDGLHEDDWKGWMAMTAQLGDQIQIVGDDLFVTSSTRILYGKELNAANAVVIKPNQVGTITETLQAIQICYENNMNYIISHRSGETEDSFIADLAVATSAGQIKAGSCSRSERLAKYNRLLRIEDRLIRSLLNM